MRSANALVKIRSSHLFVRDSLLANKKHALVRSTQNPFFLVSGQCSLSLVQENRRMSNASAASMTETSPHPSLVKVPTLPVIGSLIPQYSGVPPNIMDPYEFWTGMRKKFGSFYQMGFPSFGRKDDIFHRMYVIDDPNEMVKIVRAGGSYPSGIIEALWANGKWYESRSMLTKGIWHRGKEWKRIRNFLQTDLLHPDSARGYVPGIMEAARLASKGAPTSSKEMNLYLSRCAFDMFASLMLGEMTQVADKNSPTEEENQRFVDAAVEGLGKAIVMTMEPKELLLGKVLGIETQLGRESFGAIDKAWELAKAKIDRFLEAKEAGTLDEYQQSSYLARAFDRQKLEGSNVSVEEVKEIVFLQLFAAVDTTSSAVGWNLLHIARLPEVQEKIYRELRTSLSKTKTSKDGTTTDDSFQLTEDVLDKSNYPYFHAVLRETQRLTPLGPIFVSKEVMEMPSNGNLTLHGERVSKGDVVALEGYATLTDPAIVDNPQSFVPERWLDDAVEARKGTPREIMDHPFFRGPFSQGARRCPGSRVASNEIQIMLAQLVLDWKIGVPPQITNSDRWKDHVPYQQLTTVEAHLPNFTFEPRRNSNA